MRETVDQQKSEELTRAEVEEARRREYIERVRESTRLLAERVRRSEQLTADDFAIQINATDFV